jgi:hypothetical protein
MPPRPLYPRKEPSIHLTGGWVSLKDGLDILEKKKRLSLPGFEHWTVQPVVYDGCLKVFDL